MQTLNTRDLVHATFPALGKLACFGSIRGFAPSSNLVHFGIICVHGGLLWLRYGHESLENTSFMTLCQHKSYELKVVI